MIKWGILYDAKQEGGGLLSLLYKYTQNDDDDVIALHMEIFKIRFFFGRAWADQCDGFACILCLFFFW